MLSRVNKYLLQFLQLHTHNDSGVEFVETSICVVELLELFLLLLTDTGNSIGAVLGGSNKYF